MTKEKYVNWTSRDWNRWIDALNAELPPEKCPAKLNDEEREDYIKSLELLKKKREQKTQTFRSVTGPVRTTGINDN